MAAAAAAGGCVDGCAGGRAGGCAGGCGAADPAASASEAQARSTVAYSCAADSSTRAESTFRCSSALRSAVGAGVRKESASSIACRMAAASFAARCIPTLPDSTASIAPTSDDVGSIAHGICGAGSRGGDGGCVGAVDAAAEEAVDRRPPFLGRLSRESSKPEKDGLCCAR